MAISNTSVLIKRSLVTPTPATLKTGELAYSYASNNIFIGTGDGQSAIAIGGYNTYEAVNSATSSNTASTLVKRDSNGAFSGRVYGLANSAIQLDTGRNFSVSGGDISASAISFNGTSNVTLNASLNDVPGLTANTVGSSTAVPVITYGANGRILNVTTAAISSDITLSDGEKKYIVVKYSPEIYVIDKILKPDRAGYEKLRYTLKTLGGEPLLTQKKWNKPNKIRRQKRFFASDFVKIEKEDMPDNITYEPGDGTDEDAKYKQNDGLDIHKALKLNIIEDKETEARKPKPPKKTRIKKEPVPVVPSERPTRTRKPNQFLKGFVEINDDGEVTKVLGTGFVLIGGKKHTMLF